jgi:hypothetical protein
VKNLETAKAEKRLPWYNPDTWGVEVRDENGWWNQMSHGSRRESAPGGLRF